MAGAEIAAGAVASQSAGGRAGWRREGSTKRLTIRLAPALRKTARDAEKHRTNCLETAPFTGKSPLHRA
jgi:hypothetical protein